VTPDLDDVPPLRSAGEFPQCSRGDPVPLGAATGSVLVVGNGLALSHVLHERKHGRIC